MIDMKEAWDAGHPDKISALSTARLKQLHTACEWYSDSKHTKFPRGFRMRARALEREVESRRHSTATKIAIFAAVVACVAAAASWVAAIHPVSKTPEQSATKHQPTSSLRGSTGPRSSSSSVIPPAATAPSPTETPPKT